MTGFGRSSLRVGAMELRCTVRSGNSRHLDLKTTVDNDLADHRAAVEAVTRRHLRRGSVALSVQCVQDEASVSSAVEPQLLERFRHTRELLRREGITENDFRYADFLRWQAANKQESAAAAPIAQSDVERVVSEALQELLLARQAEGQTQAAFFKEALQRLHSQLGELALGAKAAEEQTRARLTKLAATSGLFSEIDQPRVAQEIVFYLERLTVQEELQRFTGHLRQVEELLAQQGPLGRKLEFYGQELLRELNTLGAKIQGESYTRTVVEMKALLEDYREQVHNVE